MKKVLKFKRKKTPLQITIITILFAVVLGIFIGIFLPEDISVFKSSSTPTNINADIVGRAIVTDGDTIRINNIRIRLDAIDAPEINQTCMKDGVSYNCGQQSKIHLIQLIDNNDVSCIVNGEDQYNRQLATCYNDKNEDLNAEMVSSGNAIAYLFYSNKYESQQIAARNNKNGIWAGEFIEPYLFRRNN